MAAQTSSARTDGKVAEKSAGPSEAADPTPSSFEYRSRLKVFGLPLVHVVRGIDPSSGRRPTAVGIIAIGQVAVGVIAIGQVAVGGISLGQASIGLGWGLGQLAFGLRCRMDYRRGRQQGCDGNGEYGSGHWVASAVVALLCPLLS